MTGQWMPFSVKVVDGEPVYVCNEPKFAGCDDFTDFEVACDHARTCHPPTPPEEFGPGRADVVASVKVADDPTEHPHKHVIITQDYDNTRAFAVHTVTYNGRTWVSGQGHYDLPWNRAVDMLADAAKRAGRPMLRGR